jgi:hypothetical protein
LESDPIKSGDVLIELHKEIATIRNQRNNKIEFFSIDPFYRLAHKNPDALQLFNDLTAIKPIPDDHAKTEEEKSNVYFCATYTSHLKGDLIMGDKYVNNGQAGAVGANAKSDGNSFFQTQSSFKNKPNLEAVIEELGKLRDEMRKLSTDIEHDSSIVAVGQAIIAGDKKDLSSVLVHLKSAGKWALSISEKLGLKIAEKLILDAIEQ